MAITNKSKQNNKEELPKTKPNIPPGGILNSSSKNTNQDAANETIIKKWRQIILQAIKPQEKKEQAPFQKPPAKPEPQQKNNLSTRLKVFEKPKKFYIKIAGFIILGLILITAAIGFGIYNLGWQGEAITKISKIIPYPSAIIKTPCGYKNVSLANFNFDQKAINHFYEQKKQTDKNFVIPETNQITTDIYEKELKNKLLECFAKQKGVLVSPEQIQTEMEKTILQAGSREALEEITKNLYNWDLETFKQKVLYVYLLEGNLSKALRDDPEVNLEALKKAEEIYKQVETAPQNFYTLAKKYSEDTESRHHGGDLNWIEKGQLNEAIETAAFNLEVGQTSEILQTPAGYHIIKITDKKTGLQGIDQVRISHILIKTRDIENWLDEKLKESKIYKFI